MTVHRASHRMKTAMFPVSQVVDDDATSLRRIHTLLTEACAIADRLGLDLAAIRIDEARTIASDRLITLRA